MTQATTSIEKPITWWKMLHVLGLVAGIGIVVDALLNHRLFMATPGFVSMNVFEAGIFALSIAVTFYALGKQER